MSFIIVGTGLAVAGTALGMHSANKAQKAAEKKAAAAKAEMDALKTQYANLDTSNPWMNMQNTMEDLTINQAQFDLADRNFTMSQANVFENTRGLGGSAGANVASIAQAIVGQGELQDQQMAADIGMQERQNEITAAQEAANIQNMERQGDIWSRAQEKDIQGTLLGMQQQEVAAAREQIAAANQAKWDAISGGVNSIGNMLVQPPGISGM